MEYVIINGRIPDIETDVNNCIKDGFIPLGGIAAGSGGLFQAMTRTRKPEAIKTPREKTLVTPQQVISLFNKFFAKHAVTRSLKPSKATLSRLTNCIRTEFKTISDWQDYFELIEMSDFLMGQVPPSNGFRQFRLSLDYVINDTNISKILERRV